MTAEDEIYADARKAIEALRKAAWKGIDGDRDEFRETLQGDLNHFDGLLKILLGPSEFELKQLAEE